MREKLTRGKRTAMASSILGIAVLLGAGFALKDHIREQWYLWKLD